MTVVSLEAANYSKTSL